IINEIVAANPKLIPVKPILFIDRSPSVNAYAIGGNIIAVNLGLLSFVEYREELAMVIAHELSHNILNHPDKSMKERAEWLTSDEYKQSLNAVLESKYERLTRLKKVFEGYSFDRSKHSRYHESDADSLALVLLKTARIAYSPEFFLRLDSSDIQYKQPLKNSIKNYFTAYNLAFEDTWTQKRSRGLSTKSYNFKDTTGMEDSLKTHPDCKDRYRKALQFPSAHNKLTPLAIAIREKATKMLVWNMFDKQSLTACLYRILQEKDKGNKDEWYDFMLSNVFSGLYYADKQLSRFNAIGIVPKETISKDYYELQSLLEQIPRDSLEKYCKDMNNMSFWQNMPSDAKAFKSFLNTLNFNEETSNKIKETAAKEFSINNSNSMFNEFVSQFKK
ncbi:MAG TPA: M48 family metallopeptidase, partial [Segetibacter sp.]